MARGAEFTHDARATALEMAKAISCRVALRADTTSRILSVAEPSNAQDSCSRCESGTKAQWAMTLVPQEGRA